MPRLMSISSPIRTSLPLYFSFQNTGVVSGRGREGNWVDGLRGVAAIEVVIFHLNRAFNIIVLSPAVSENGPANIGQWPILRVIPGGGQTAVALFFLFTGYGSSLSAFSKLQLGGQEVMLSSIAKGALARPFRLILPTAILTTIGWFLCQVNAYAITPRTDASWIRDQYVAPSPTLGRAIVDLVNAQIDTWTKGFDVYDMNQWTQAYLLQASMAVYLFLLATSFATPTARRLILAFFYLFAWRCGDALKTINFLPGMLLADLHVSLGSSAPSYLPRPIAACTILLGLLLGSYPEVNAGWAGWSRYLDASIRALMPAGAGEPSRYCASLGATFLCFGIFFSGPARKLLSHRVLNWLGALSFPIYLLHNTLIKTLLCAIIYARGGVFPEYDEQGAKVVELKRGGWIAFGVGMPLFFGVLLWLSWCWTVIVDPFCARVTKASVDWLMGKKRVVEKETEPMLLVSPTTA